MKLRIKKSAWIGVFLIIIMLGSTFAYSIIQGLGFYQPTANTEIELPESNIIDYELTKEQESYAIRLGKTILKFEYETTCVECLDQKTFIESLANDRTFSNQVILEEVAKDVDNSVLTITSFYGRRILTNVTNDEIVDGVCELLTEPPVFCTVRNV